MRVDREDVEADLSRDAHSAARLQQVAWTYEPGTRIDAADLASRNAVFRRRKVFRREIEGRPFEIGQPRPWVEASLAERACLAWSCGDHDVIAAVEFAALEALLARIQPDFVELPDPDTTALLIEMAFAAELDAAERRIGAPLVCRGLVPADKPRPGTEAICIPCRFDGLPLDLVLWPRGSDRTGWAALMKSLAGLLGPEVEPLADMDIPVALAFEAGGLTLPLAALRRAQPGDVLIPDRFAFARSEVDIVIGRGRSARAKIDGDQLRLSAAPGRRMPKETHRVSLTDTTTAAAGGADPAGLDGIVIDLTFEIGRSTIELAELRSLAPGHVFPLGRDPKASIDILANGRRIGRGEIVRVGDTLGVRIVRLADKTD